MTDDVQKDILNEALKAHRKAASEERDHLNDALREASALKLRAEGFVCRGQYREARTAFRQAADLHVEAAKADGAPANHTIRHLLEAVGLFQEANRLKAIAIEGPYNAEQRPWTTDEWRRTGSFIYALNHQGTNRFDAHFLAAGPDCADEAELEANAALAILAPRMADIILGQCETCQDSPETCPACMFQDIANALRRIDEEEI